MVIESSLSNELKRPLIMSVICISLYLTIFSAWSYLAPISGAIIALGEVRPIANNQYEIQARLNPLDIDQAVIGGKARINFSSYSMKKQSPILQKVSYIANDTQYDPIANQAYYLIKIPLNQNTLTEKNPFIQLKPGLPVEVFIQTEKRTLFDYLTDSIINLKEKGMRE